jgi:hypothetical protein
MSATSCTAPRRQSGEGVDGPQHARLLVVEAAGGGGIEDRGDYEVQPAVAGLEGLTWANPAHAPDVERPLHRQPLRHEEVRNENGVGTALHQLVEVADVVAVVMGEEHPADVLWLHQGEHLLEPVIAVDGRPCVDDHRLRAADEH